MADLPDGLVCLPLSDMAVPPARGNFLVFEGSRYEVAEVVEFFGFRDRNGRRFSGQEKLMAVIGAMYPDVLKASAMLAGMKDVGFAEKPEEVTAGGIILPEESSSREFDHVLFVKVRAVRSNDLPSVRLTRASALVGPDAPGEHEDACGEVAPGQD